MKYLKILFLSLLIFPCSAFSCSFISNDKFIPTLERWEQHPGPGQTGGSGSYWEPIPQPEVKVVEISRASYTGNDSCGDAGSLTLELSLPDDSTYSISEFGTFFRVLDGDMPDEIFPDIPLVGFYDDDKARFTFVWLDHRPNIQSPLDLILEVFFVTDSLNVGKPSYIDIKSSAR